MKINGYQIREGIKRWLLQRDAAANAFKDSLYVFKGEEKDAPEKVMADFNRADRNMARLEELQQIYNQMVVCQVLNQKMTLALLVKLVGGAGRREKMWREATVGKKDRYDYNDSNRERDKDKEYSERTLTVKKCSEHSQEAAKLASAMRNAIARGNSTDVEVDTKDTKKSGIINLDAPVSGIYLTSDEYKDLFE